MVTLAERGTAIYSPVPADKRIETINGILNGRGFGILRARSMAKVKCIALLQAIAHNLWRARGLRTVTA